MRTGRLFHYVRSQGVALGSLLALTLLAPLAIASEAQPVEPDAGWGRPTWRVGNVQVVLDVACHVETVALWPVGRCATPHLLLLGEEGARLRVHDTTLEAGRFQTERGRTLFNKLAEDDDPTVFIASRRFASAATPVEQRAVLLDFPHQVKRITAQQKDRVQALALERQSVFVRIVLGLLIGGAIVVYVIWAGGRVLKRQARMLTQRTTQGVRQRRIRRVAEEETIRHMTRQELDQASEQECAVLKQQIGEALAEGDTATAKSLFGLLERLEKGRASTAQTTVSDVEQ